MVAKVGAALLAVASTVSAQMLRPITLHGGNVKRSAGTFAMDHEIDMEYADMDTYNAADVDTFGATVHITTVNPSVQTEDFGSLVSDITCANNNTMKVTFANADAAGQAKAQWTADKMTIITFTSTCNEDDERVPWVVSKPIFDGTVATLAGKPSDWTTESSSMRISFGSKGNMTNPNAPAVVSKRDSVQGSLNFDFEDKSIYPPSVFNKLPISVHVSNQLTQTCVKCTNSGTVKFEGDIKVKDALLEAAGKLGDTVESVGNNVATKVVSAANSVETTVTGFFGDLFGKREDPWAEMADKLDIGTIGISLNGFKGHFEFRTDVYTGKEFNVPLLGNGGISPIQVKGIFQIGPSISPQLVFKFDADDDLTFNYGFEYTLPDNSGLELNLLDPSKSKLTGLDQIKIKALPFSTNAKEVAKNGITYSAAFRPEIAIGADILGQSINPIELYIDAPRFDGTVKGLTDVGSDCKGHGNQDAFQLDGSFSFGVGIGADINIGSIVENPKYTLGDKKNLWPQSICKAVAGGAASSASGSSSTKRHTRTKTASASGTKTRTVNTASTTKSGGHQVETDGADSGNGSASVTRSHTRTRSSTGTSATSTGTVTSSKTSSAAASVTPAPVYRRHARHF